MLQKGFGVTESLLLYFFKKVNYVEMYIPLYYDPSKPNKAVLDTFFKNRMTELYTCLAGLTAAYITITIRDFNLSESEAQKELMKIDADVRKNVAKAYQLYDLEKNDDEHS